MRYMNYKYHEGLSGALIPAPVLHHCARVAKSVKDEYRDYLRHPWIIRRKANKAGVSKLWIVACTGHALVAYGWQMQGDEMLTGPTVYDRDGKPTDNTISVPNLDPGEMVCLRINAGIGKILPQAAIAAYTQMLVYDGGDQADLFRVPGGNKSEAVYTGCELPFPAFERMIPEGADKGLSSQRVAVETLSLAAPGPKAAVAMKVCDERSVSVRLFPKFADPELNVFVVSAAIDR